MSGSHQAMIHADHSKKKPDKIGWALHVDWLSYHYRSKARCSSQLIGSGQAFRSFSGVSVAGWLPAAMCSTMSGAKKARESSLLTYDLSNFIVMAIDRSVGYLPCPSSDKYGQIAA